MSLNLKTRYMGLELKNPLVVSSSPLSRKVESIRRMEDAGAAAVVLFSIFEEQIRHDAEALAYQLSAGSESFAEAVTYFPDLGAYQVGPERYLELVQQAVRAVQIPVIASLNGVSPAGWVDYARKIQAAGAHGLELNIYYIPADKRLNGSKVEKMYIETVKAVKAAVTIPVAVKLSPYLSATANMARKLAGAGADALVLFNRFYQPDFDLEQMEVVPTLRLSNPEEIRVPLRWIAILYKNTRVSLAASTGVWSGTEAAKYILAGADVVMTASALLEKGIPHLAVILEELRQVMAAREYSSIRQMRGAMSRHSVANPAAFERANYIKALEAYKAPYII